MKIFLSYTTRDSIITPEHLQEILPALSYFGGVFIDALHNDSIDKQQRVKKELDAADLVILLKSQSILKSKWVTWEINRAAALGIPILPISITNDQEFLPQVLQQLS